MSKGLLQKERYSSVSRIVLHCENLMSILGRVPLLVRHGGQDKTVVAVPRLGPVAYLSLVPAEVHVEAAPFFVVTVVHSDCTVVAMIAGDLEER